MEIGILKNVKDGTHERSHHPTNSSEDFDTLLSKNVRELLLPPCRAQYPYSADYRGMNG